MAALASRLLDWVDWAEVPVDERGDWRRAEIALLAALSDRDHPCVAPGVLAWYDPQWRAFARKVLHREPVEWAEPVDVVQYTADEAAAVRALTEGAEPPALTIDETTSPSGLSHRVLWATGFGATTLDRPDLAEYLLSIPTDPLPEHLTELDIAANCVLGAVLCQAEPEVIQAHMDRLLAWADEAWPPDWGTNIHPFIVVAIAERLSEGARL